MHFELNVEAWCCGETPKAEKNEPDVENIVLK